MKKRIIAVAVLALLLQSYSCKETSDPKVLTKEVVFTKEGTVQIIEKETDSILANLDVEFATTDYETQTGLMYRKGMEPNQSMLFIFKEEMIKSFYMKNTQFSLDIIYLNKDLEIVSIAKNAKPMDPTSLRSEGPAQYVLEVNAGLSNEWGLKVGDKISYSKTN